VNSEIKRVRLLDIKPSGTFRLSYPLRPELYGELERKISPLPLLVINPTGEIVFGHDFFEYLKNRDSGEIEAMSVQTGHAESLVLNFNLKTKYTGVNTYEKLVFIKKILPLLEPKDIYRDTDLDIGIDRQLTGKLDRLLGEEFKNVWVSDMITLKCGLKLCDFLPGDRGVLLDLFSSVGFSNSHQLRILEMSEEIVFRDKCPLADVFKRLDTESLLENDKPQKSIVDAVFRFRNPLYMAEEEKWQKDLKALKLPPGMQVAHFPFFEKKQLSLTVSLRDTEALKLVLKKLGRD
jgi:hypothetical protein